MILCRAASNVSGNGCSRGQQQESMNKDAELFVSCKDIAAVTELRIEDDTNSPSII